MEDMETFLIVAVRNEVLRDLFESNGCYRVIRNLEIVRNDDYDMVIVGNGVHGQAPMTVDAAHRGLMEYLKTIPALANDIQSKDSQIRGAYEFIQWSDTEDDYNDVTFNYMHGFADYTENADGNSDTVELFEGIAKPKMAFYAKTGSEWDALSSVDFDKYGVAINLAGLAGKKVFTYSYKDGWKPGAKTIEVMNKEIEDALMGMSDNDLFYVVTYPVLGGFRSNYYFGCEMHTSKYGEDFENLMNVDAFFDEQPDYEDFRAVVKGLAGAFGGEEATINEDEWENLKEFGLDTDKIQEEIVGKFMDVLGSLEDILEQMKDLIGGMDDEEDEE